MAEKTVKTLCQLPPLRPRRWRVGDEDLVKGLLLRTLERPSKGRCEFYLKKRDYLHGGIEPPNLAETVGELFDSFLSKRGRTYRRETSPR